MYVVRKDCFCDCGSCPSRNIKIYLAEPINYFRKGERSEAYKITGSTRWLGNSYRNDGHVEQCQQHRNFEKKKIESVSFLEYKDDSKVILKELRALERKDESDDDSEDDDV